MNEPEPEPRTEDLHASGALKLWLTIKEELRAELPEDEWKLWVRPMRLLRVLDHNFLVLVMPPNGAIIQASSQRKQMLRAKLAQYGYSFGFAPYPDDWQSERLRSMGWDLRSKWKPQVKAVV